MPAITEQRYDFRGGMSRLRRQNQTEVYLSQNARPRADGTLEVRNGQTLYTNIGSTGSIERLYARYTVDLGLRFYSIRRTDGSNDLIYSNETQISGPDFGANDYCSVVEYKGVLFFSNGVTPINYHDPSANPAKAWGAEVWGASAWGAPQTRAEVTGTPTPPKGQHMVIYKDRLYVGTSDGLVYYSNAGLFTTLPTVDMPALNFQTIGGPGNPVTGLAAGEDFLLAFTRGSYHVMTGVPDDDGGLGDMAWQVFQNIGCTASRSISTQGRRVAFLGTDRRMYILDGSVLTDIDEDNKMQEYFLAVDSSVLRTVASTFFRDELWIRLPSGNSETVGNTLVYNLSSKKWTVFSGMDSYSFFFCPDVGKLFLGKATSSKIYDPTEGATEPDGSLIPLSFISRQEVFGTLRKRKLFSLLYLQTDQNQGETLNLSYAIDNTTEFTAFGVGSTSTATGKAWGAEAWGVSAWGGVQMRRAFARLSSGGSGIRGTEFRFKASGNVSPGTRILSYEIEATVEERDGEVL